MPYPPPRELTSHQAPALLVESLTDAAADGSYGESRLLNPNGLDLLQLIEGSAQTVAILMGLALHATGGPRAKGMLVGVKDAVQLTDIAPGATVEVRVSLTYQLPPFSLFRAVVTSAGQEVATLELKTMAQPT